MKIHKVKKEDQINFWKECAEFFEHAIAEKVGMTHEELFGSDNHQPFNPLLGLPRFRLPEFQEDSLISEETWNQIRLNGRIVIQKKPKVHPMDAHYPHICANPKHNKKLKWRELLNQNIITSIEKRYLKYPNDFKLIIHKFNEGYKQYKHLKQWWRSKHMEFLCCSCYQMVLQNKCVQETWDYKIPERGLEDCCYYEDP